MTFPQARQGMSPSGGLRALLFVLGVLVLSPLTLQPANALAARSLLPSQALWTAALNWGVFLAVAISTAVAARLERRPFGEYGYPRRRAGARLTEGFAWGVTTASFAAVILRVTGAANFDSAALPVAAATVSGVSWWLSRLGFAGLDQLMWRGYLQVTGARGVGFWPAAWVLTIVFTVEKLLGTQYRHALPIVAFLAWGLLSALTLRRTGSLWFGTGLQLGLDWGMVFLYGLAVQGTSAQPPGTLMSASAHNALFTGGDAGMRGSVVMPALIGLAAVLVHVRFSVPGRTASPPHQQA
jgi:membrane protease YdiL (CAAX protease family)